MNWRRPLRRFHCNSRCVLVIACVGGAEEEEEGERVSCCSSAHCTSLSYRRSTDQTRLGREGGEVATALRPYSPPFKRRQSSEYPSVKHEKGACPADLLHSEATIYIYIYFYLFIYAERRERTPRVWRGGRRREKRVRLTEVRSGTRASGSSRAKPVGKAHGAAAVRARSRNGSTRPKVLG